MGIMDKIMGVTKKKNKFDIPKLDLGAEHSTDTPKPSSLDSPGLGGMGDSAAGLGGTGDLGSMSHSEQPSNESHEDTIHGFGHEDVGMEPAKLQQETHPQFSKPTILQEAKPETAVSIGATTKDLEIISSKLDTLRATLEMINNRLSTIEMQMNEQKRRGGW